MCMPQIFGLELGLGLGLGLRLELRLTLGLGFLILTLYQECRRGEPCTKCFVPEKEMGFRDFWPERRPGTQRWTRVKPERYHTLCISSYVSFLIETLIAKYHHL